MQATNIFVYPTYLDDVVWGIEKSLFSPGTRGAAVSLMGERTTVAGVAEVIRSLKPGAGLEYVGGKANERFLEETVMRLGRSLISWEHYTQLVEGVAATLDWVEKEKNSLHFREEPQKELHRKVLEKEETSQTVEAKKQGLPESFWDEFSKKRKLSSTEKRRRKKSWVSKLFFEHAGLSVTVVGLVLLMLWFFVLPFVMFGFGVGNLKMVFLKAKESKYSEIPLWGGASRFWFKQAEAGFGQWESLPGFGKIGQKYVQESQALSGVARVLVEKGNVTSEFSEVVAGVFGSQSFQNASILNKANSLSASLATLEQELAFLEAQIASLSGENGSFFYFPQKIDLMRSDMRASGALLGLASYLLGEDAKRTYLVLVQDNTELRPTGGYVAAYGLLTFDKGRLIASEFQNTQLADSQLSGQVEPPAPIKTYLGERSWYLQDVSWSGDFSTTASRASWFVDKELSVKVDGVISVDLQYLKSLLSLTGPLKVEALGNVTEQNMYELLFKVNSASSFDRSRGLVYLVRSVFQTITESPELFAGSVVSTAFENLRSKHVSIFIDNPKAQEILDMAFWSGVIREGTCKFTGAFCQADYLYFTEANLGINKANYFLDRSHNLDVSLAGGKLVHKLTVGYKNKSSGEWPGGEYKNYFRVYVPADSEKFSAVLVNQEKSEQEDVTLNLGSEREKRTAGGFFVVPPGESRQLFLVWEIPVAVGLGQYSLLWQKQPGTGDDPVWLAVSNKDRGVGKVAPLPSLTTRESIGYNTKLTRDLEFSVQWQENQR